MKKNTINTDINDSTSFAFLPEMVLERLDQMPIIESTEVIKEIENVENQISIQNEAIVFEPIADPFEGLIIETTTKKKEKK